MISSWTNVIFSLCVRVCVCEREREKEREREIERESERERLTNLFRDERKSSYLPLFC